MRPAANRIRATGRRSYAAARYSSVVADGRGAERADG
jgi:hypothetical protein